MKVRTLFFDCLEIEMNQYNQDKYGDILYLNEYFDNNLSLDYEMAKELRQGDLIHYRCFKIEQKRIDFLNTLLLEWKWNGNLMLHHRTFSNDNTLELCFLAVYDEFQSTHIFSKINI